MIKDFSSRILPAGKADYIKQRLPDGTIEDVCLCTHTSRFTFGCEAQVSGRFGIPEEVVRNHGEYSEGNINIYRQLGIHDLRCDGCYARKMGRRSNWGKTNSGHVNSKTRADFEKYKPSQIRLGVLVECGYLPLYGHVLNDFLGLCEEYSSRVILPTKMLTFGKESLIDMKHLLPDMLKSLPTAEELVEKFKNTMSVVNFSIYNPKFEPGLVSQGFTSNRRMKEAEKFYQSGVNTTITQVCDVTASIEDNISRGFPIDDVIIMHDELGIIMRIIPLRITTKKFAQQATGKTWEELISSKDYKLKGNHEIIPNFLHPDFQALIESGVGFCGRIGTIEYCDHCNLDKAKISFPASELAPDRDKIKKRRKIV
ncbi:MAG: hypothetical protein ABIH72_01015 [archaeon]